MLSRRFIVGVYGLAAALGAGVALALGHDPLRTRALLAGVAPPLVLDGLGLALGAGVAALGIASARAFVTRFSWARALQAELEPVVRGSSDADLVIAALASGIAEELLFRGLLVQVAGVLISSVLFGVLHQVRGPARFAWMLWASAMGVLLALVFVATGSLVGPIIAHVVTNAVNLRFVRDHGAPAPPRTLASLMR